MPERVFITNQSGTTGANSPRLCRFFDGDEVFLSEFTLQYIRRNTYGYGKERGHFSSENDGEKS